MKYHERLEEIQKAFENVAELIAKRENELKADRERSDDDELDCNPIEVDGAMKDLEDFGEIDVPIDLSQMMSRLNEDQKRVFDRVCEVLQNKNQILRLYVSGEGGTGKSFLIETIKHWIGINLKKVIAISAPTGIAACNINGLTIHRMFQLPVTHESMAKYTHLSDMVLKTLREKLKNVELFIIDEVSMISNVTMMFINLRLCEIFDTTDTDDVVHLKQFPLSLSYGITVHKSQGITCKNAMMDLGTSVFTDGQVYVGLSRVSTLEGLHLINFNPASVRANSGAVAEYNRLRSVFKSQLPQINSSEKKAVKIYDCRWAIPHIIDDVQNYGYAEPESIVTWKIFGLCNDDRVSCYANVTLQCAFHCVRIRQQILKNRVSNALTDAVCAYAERKRCNILAIRRSVGERFEERTQQDVSEFFTALMSTYSEINDVLEVELKHLICCSNAKYKQSEWCYCTDLQVIKKKWPRGAHGAYMLFLEQIK
ncbi:PREDICTED: uncharacterized protein LOC108768629 [Trachymyrmex cornetzi]|uniref:uncharacterized protein LOC108768629 n=1 Tax=Trachymyrmex cornetzi TaxID=471704 RepID=UPI00084F35DB|nr:PREDICTED: uncharacterized protein LOC108768629 [Trachymyrmex cornetzi]